MVRAIDAYELKERITDGIAALSEHMGQYKLVFAAITNAVQNAINEAPTIEPKQEWISVKDRLPERTLPPHDVLVYHDLNCGMFVDRAWYSYDTGKWCSVLGMKLKVTHWMPLPEPPETK